MNDSAEVRYFRSTHERRFGALRTVAKLALVAAVSAGGAVAYRKYESRNISVANAPASAPGTTEVFIPTAETEGIQTLYICTIENPDGSVNTVEININGPEDAVEIAKILAGQTGSAASILLDGVNSYNARYGSNLAMLVGNDLEVLNVSEGIGASALTSTQDFGLKQEIMWVNLHGHEAATAVTAAP